MRNNGQMELCQQAEENANMLLRELKRTVTVNEIAFVSFPERMPSIVPLLDTNGEPILNNNNKIIYRGEMTADNLYNSTSTSTKRSNTENVQDSKDVQEEEEVENLNRTTIEATLCVGDVINIDDTSDWWNILSINCETASIQVRLSSTLVGQGNGVLRFSTIRKRFNLDAANMEEMSVEDREEEKEELEAMVEHTIRWMTIQEAQCRSGE